jgi:hypothetical protein
MDRSRHGRGIARQYAAPGKRSGALIFICLTCFTGALAASWAASLFRAHSLFSFSAWLAVLAEAAVLLLACHLLTRQSGRPGGFTRRAGVDCLSCRSMRQWCHLARLDLSGPCAPSPLAVSALKAARLVSHPAIRRPYGNARRPEQQPNATHPVLCIYCRTDKFVYWPSACRLPSADCPGCQRRIAKPAATLLAGTAGAARSLSRQVRAGESAASPEMSHRKAAGR